MAVACANPDLLASAMRHLRELTITPYACSTTLDLVTFAERAHIVIVFADSFDDVPSIMSALQALERWPLGPALVVVAGPAFGWEPSVARACPALRVPRSFFDWEDRSEPELPFTD